MLLPVPMKAGGPLRQAHTAPFEKALHSMHAISRCPQPPRRWWNVAVYTGRGSDNHYHFGCDFVGGKLPLDCVRSGAGVLYDFDVGSSGKVRPARRGSQAGARAMLTC